MQKEKKIKRKRGRPRKHIAIPKGMTEEEVLAVIDKIIGYFIKKTKFGYYDEDDIRQEGYCYALDGLTRYDNKRPLENFLTVHIRNRFLSLRRDKYRRKDPPCHKCPFFDPEMRKSRNKCAAFEDKMECEPFKEWNDRNNAKQNLMSPIHLFSSKDDNKPLNVGEEEHSDFNDLLNKELIDKIGAKLHIKYRSDFFRLLDGVKIGDKKIAELREQIKLILGDIIDG